MFNFTSKNILIVIMFEIVDGVDIPEYSLVVGNPMIIKKGYYKK